MNEVNCFVFSVYFDPLDRPALQYWFLWPFLYDVTSLTMPLCPVPVLNTIPLDEASMIVLASNKRHQFVFSHSLDWKRNVQNAINIKFKSLWNMEFWERQSRKAWPLTTSTGKIRTIWLDISTDSLDSLAARTIFSFLNYLFLR